MTTINVTSADPQAPRLGYLPALDGLRAIAIFMVMAGHSWPRLAGGGLGVDVFFALSGFLITTLLLEEITSRDGSLNVGYFYIRRSLRLFPALYAALAVFGVYCVVRWSALEGFLAHSGGRRSDVPKFFLAAGTYTTNLSGLTGRPGNLLGHTWSLAVEEQFYLVWPAVLLAVTRHRRFRSLIAVIGGFAVFCFAARLLGADSLRGLLWNRPDAIALGSGAALLRFASPPFRSFFIRFGGPATVLGLASIGTIALADGFVLPEAALARGLTSYIAVASTVVVCSIAEQPTGVVARVLSRRPCVAIGLISYGLYVWHQPIFRIVTWEMADQRRVVVLTVQWAISMTAALVSYRVVERPARSLQHRFRPDTAGG